jgi:hypothetical protein
MMVTAMQMINFEIFEENSSSSDAMRSFAEGLLSFPELKNGMWDPRARAEVDKMRKLGRKNSLRRARLWCTRRGYDYKEKI